MSLTAEVPGARLSQFDYALGATGLPHSVHTSLGTNRIRARRTLAESRADAAAHPAGGGEEHPQHRRVEHRVDREAGPEWHLGEDKLAERESIVTGCWCKDTVGCIWHSVPSIPFQSPKRIAATHLFH